MDLPATNEQSVRDLRGISLCAGYAGLDLGLHIAEPSYRTVCYVERESHAAATLVARMGDETLGQAPIWSDLATFDGRPWRGRVHLVSAGYPCQPFSMAGKRRGADDPRHLWPHVARIVAEVRPEWVFCENVEGHVNLGLADVGNELRGLGYEVKAGLFAAGEVGARHLRRRLFILAHADSDGQGLQPGSDRRRGLGADDRTSPSLAPERGTIPALACGPELDGSLAADEGAWLASDNGDQPPIFAPGPSEFLAWQGLLERRPDLQPTVLRNDHGMADWMDRTRGAGNGVCSLVAALAWRTLSAAHGHPIG